MPSLLSRTLDTSFVLLSDAAHTTRLTPRPLPQSGDLIQPSVVHLPAADGSGSFLRAFLRDEDAIAIYFADSIDEGSTWSLPARTVLPSNNAGIASARLASGAVALVYVSARFLAPAHV